LEALSQAGFNRARNFVISFRSKEQHDQVLKLIAGNRNFPKNYAVMRNLLKNPKTPLDIPLHLLPNLTETHAAHARFVGVPGLLRGEADPRGRSSGGRGPAQPVLRQG
jgi:hypothetical protein